MALLRQARPGCIFSNEDDRGKVDNIRLFSGSMFEGGPILNLDLVRDGRARQRMAVAVWNGRE